MKAPTTDLVIDSATDRARFWSVPQLHNMECLSASFQTHTYSAHSHDSYGFGVFERGGLHFFSRGEKTITGNHQLLMLNPEDMHYGWPDEKGYQYRMFYLDQKHIHELMDGMKEGQSFEPLFKTPVLEDPQLAYALSETHKLYEQGASSLHQDCHLIESFTHLLHRHGMAQIGKTGKEHRAITTVLDYLHGHYAEDIKLKDLASLCDLNPHYLLRVFKKYRGCSPQNFLTSIRVEQARKLLRDKQNAVDVALACGFYDQSHFHRNFKAIVGVTPGHYAKAWPHTPINQSSTPHWTN